MRQWKSITIPPKEEGLYRVRFNLASTCLAWYEPSNFEGLDGFWELYAPGSELCKVSEIQYWMKV